MKKYTIQKTTYNKINQIVKNSNKIKKTKYNSDSKTKYYHY